MRLLIKLILLQCFWLFCVRYGHIVNDLLFFLLAIGLIVLNRYMTSNHIDKIKSVFLVIIFTSYGYLTDFVLIQTGSIQADTYHFSYLALWTVFIAYYNDAFIKFSKMSTLLLALIGLFGGSLAYYSASKLGALTVTPQMELSYYVIAGISWTLFFPFSIKLFFNEQYWDKALDYSVVLSFDSTGFKRHQKYFKEDIYTTQKEGKRALITGGTSGIGFSVAKSLDKLGVSTVITGRNKVKGDMAKDKLDHSSFIPLDMSDKAEVERFCQECNYFDYIVLNAGGMPESKTVNKEGLELQVSSQLIGHISLIKELYSLNKIANDTPVVLVSSGGMYLKSLDMNELIHNDDYDKVSTYANVKRAQVTLLEELKDQGNWVNRRVYCMHPGWVQTEGLSSALPGFTNFFGKRLRSPYEGADTILWLLLTQSLPESFAFYFDRQKVSPYVFGKHNPSKEVRDELVEFVKRYT